MTVRGALVWCLLLATPLPAAAAEYEQVEVTDVVADPAAWDGRRITLVGELVGDYSHRPEGVWVQLNDDAFVDSPVGKGGSPDSTNVGLGARIPTPVFETIEGGPGRYGRRGPIVRLEGRFKHSDPSLQGETYLDVETAETLQPAVDYPTPGPDPWLAVGGLLLAVSIRDAFRRRRNARRTEEAAVKS